MQKSMAGMEKKKTLKISPNMKKLVR